MSSRASSAPRAAIGVFCYYRITDSGIERSKALDEECDRMREACFSKLSDEELAKHTELLDKLIR